MLSAFREDRNRGGRPYQKVARQPSPPTARASPVVWERRPQQGLVPPAPWCPRQVVRPLATQPRHSQLSQRSSQNKRSLKPVLNASGHPPLTTLQIVGEKA